ncbi:MAG: 30S ribosomal protein S20 [Acidobacteriota bacterium]
MPNHKSAEKRDRQNARRNERNTAGKTKLRSQIKKLRSAISHNKADDAKALHGATIAVIDKAVQKGILHRNTAARHKSRLTVHVNKLAAK